jgi:hypothetical protein
VQACIDSFCGKHVPALRWSAERDGIERNSGCQQRIEVRKGIDAVDGSVPTHRRAQDVMRIGAQRGNVLGARNLAYTDERQPDWSIRSSHSLLAWPVAAIIIYYAIYVFIVWPQHAVAAIGCLDGRTRQLVISSGLLDTISSSTPLPLHE